MKVPVPGYVVIITDVIILPEYQGSGIGKCLMQDMMNYIHTNLKEGQSVLINLMAAKDKELFYERFGFEQRPTGTLGAGMTQWVRK